VRRIMCDISSLRDLQSLTFMMKLANWRREILLAGCSSLTKVSYFRRLKT